MIAPVLTEAEQRADLVLYDTTAIVAARWHYCAREITGSGACPGAEVCPDARVPATDNPCMRGGTRDGYRCCRCGRWGETMRDIRHRDAGCLPLRHPPRARRRSS